MGYGFRKRWFMGKQWVMHDGTEGLMAQAEPEPARRGTATGAGVDGGNRQFVGQGVRAVLPFLPGVAAFGLVFGALAVSKGASPLSAVAMSVLVSAGSSQIAAVELAGDEAPLLIILSAVFLINLRNFLYSASLAPLLPPLARPWRWLVAFPVADESYGVTIARQKQTGMPPRGLLWFFAGAGTVMLSAWWLFTLAGAYLGNALPQALLGKLGFISPLIFTGLVVPMLRDRATRLAAVSAALAAVLLNPLPFRSGVLLAAGIGIGLGLFADRGASSATCQVSSVKCQVPWAPPIRKP
jgi:predicted branched-subunit amino acid permease